MPGTFPLSCNLLITAQLLLISVMVVHILFKQPDTSASVANLCQGYKSVTDRLKNFTPLKIVAVSVDNNL